MSTILHQIAQLIRHAAVIVLECLQKNTTFSMQSMLGRTRDLLCYFSLYNLALF